MIDIGKLAEDVKNQQMRAFLKNLIDRGKDPNSKTYLRILENDANGILTEFGMEKDLAGRIFFLRGSGTYKIFMGLIE